MELKYSEKGIPFVELDEKNKLVFSTTTSNDKGYKWLMFSGVTTTTGAISAGKGKTKRMKTFSVTEPISMMINMNFDGITKLSKSGNNNQFLTKNYLEGIKKMFQPYVVDGVFLFKNMEKFKKNINSFDKVDSEDYLDEDPMGYYTEEEMGEDDE